MDDVTSVQLPKGVNESGGTHLRRGRQSGLVQLVAQPVLVALVQVLQVVDAHPCLLAAAAVLHAAHARLGLGAQVDEAVRHQGGGHLHHRVEPVSENGRSHSHLMPKLDD